MNTKLPVKGVLGLGKESTLYYLNRLQERYRSSNDEWSTCPFVMYQIDFQEINPFLPNKFSILIPKMEKYLTQIANLGITKLLVPNITLHETLDQFHFPMNICHPITLTLKYLKENTISEVFLFGTAYTMNSDYIHRRFSENNIHLSLPTEADQEWMDNFRKLVYAKKTNSNQIAYFQMMLKKYSCVNPVIIGCTELSLYSLNNDKLCIDMADLQIEEFLR